MIKKLSAYIGEYKLQTILTPVLVMLEVIMDIGIPLIMADLIDQGIEQGNMDVILKYGVPPQSEAILMINKATAEGLRMIKEAGADEAVIKLKSLEAFTAAADGQATKIIIPSEIQSLAGLVASVKEISSDK